jgi:hypothetical protein
MVWLFINCVASLFKEGIKGWLFDLRQDLVIGFSNHPRTPSLSKEGAGGWFDDDDFLL